MLSLLDRRVIFFGGKGGVGKTTMAAAFAVMAARRGKSCLLVSTDPAHSLGDIFERTIGASETCLDPGLFGLEIDAEAEADRYIGGVKQTMRGLVRPEFYGEVDRQLDLARFAPGAAEAALLERVADLMAHGLRRYDIVVFDTAPTGHTIRLLSLPEVMAAWTDGMLRHEDRSRHLGSILERMGGRRGRETGDELSYIDEAERGAGGEASRDPAARIRASLQARRTRFLRARRLLLDATTTAFVLVLMPERLPILETGRALATLRRFQVPVAAMVVNRVLPLSAAGTFLDKRREQQAFYLDEIERTFAAVPRLTVELFETDVQGLEMLRDIAGILARTSLIPVANGGRPSSR